VNEVEEVLVSPPNSSTSSPTFSYAGLSDSSSDDGNEEHVIPILLLTTPLGQDSDVEFDYTEQEEKRIDAWLEEERRRLHDLEESKKMMEKILEEERIFKLAQVQAEKKACLARVFETAVTSTVESCDELPDVFEDESDDEIDIELPPMRSYSDLSLPFDSATVENKIVPPVPRGLNVATLAPSPVEEPEEEDPFADFSCINFTEEEAEEYLQSLTWEARWEIALSQRITRYGQFLEVPEFNQGL
jgi:hypothetical protein